MYEGCKAELKMVRTLSIDAVFDEEIRNCKIYKYDAEGDYMQLLLENGNLADISLDAKYDCWIMMKKESISCSGVVRERFHCDKGSMLIFEIENGFYNRFTGEKDRADEK